MGLPVEMTLRQTQSLRTFLKSLSVLGDTPEMLPEWFTLQIKLENTDDISEGNAAEFTGQLWKKNNTITHFPSSLLPSSGVEPSVGLKRDSSLCKLLEPKSHILNVESINVVWPVKAVLSRLFFQDLTDKSK